MCIASAKAEEGQDRQNHDNQADEIDKTVHEFPPYVPPPFSEATIFPNRQSSSCSQEKVANRNL
jgi:hypothetical protein